MRAATHTYPQYANQMQYALTGTFSSGTTGYLGLTTAKNWIEIGGISGILTNVAIQYWGDTDSGGLGIRIAKTIDLQVDEDETLTRLTRGGRGYTSYSPTVKLPIHKKLKIYFSNSTGVNVAAFLIYSIKFTMKDS